MPLEAVSFTWLTAEPLERFGDLLARLGSSGLLAQGLELDEQQLEALAKDPALRGLRDAAQAAAAKGDARALAAALKGTHAPGELFAYFRLAHPGKLEGEHAAAYQALLGKPPPEDKLGFSPLAPFEAWASFRLDDVIGQRRSAQVCGKRRKAHGGLAVPVWRVDDAAAPKEQERWESKGSLELRTQSDNAPYLAFALSRAELWSRDEKVLVQVL